MGLAVSAERLVDRALVRRVLIVEDDPALSELLTMVIDEQGYEVTAVASGLAAIEAARQLRPDVITLDLGLPDIDGQAVLDLLGADVRTSSIPVVVVSAFAEVLQPSSQVCAVIGKPFDLNGLLKTIARIMPVN